MARLYWQFETSIFPVISVSLRSEGKGNTRKKYNRYVKKFKMIYSDKIIRCSDTYTIYPYPGRVEYVTIISLDIELNKLKYPGFLGYDKLDI